MIPSVKKEAARHSDQLPMFVLDVLRHGEFQLPILLDVVNEKETIGWRAFWPRDFNTSDLIPALEQLARDGLVAVLDFDMRPVSPDGIDVFRDQASLWFGLSENGRRALRKWDPPVRG
jgi:hypothetical protein